MHADAVELAVGVVDEVSLFRVAERVVECVVLGERVGLGKREYVRVAVRRVDGRLDEQPLSSRDGLERLLGLAHSGCVSVGERRGHDAQRAAELFRVGVALALGVAPEFAVGELDDLADGCDQSRVGIGVRIGVPLLFSVGRSQ